MKKNVRLTPITLEWLQFPDNTVMSVSQLIDALGIRPIGTPDADVLSGSALADMITTRGGQRLESRGWRDGNIACVSDEWRIVA